MLGRLISAVARRLPARLYERLAMLASSSPLVGRLARRGTADLRGRDVVIGGGLGKGLRFNTFDGIAAYAVGTAEPHVQETLAELVRPGATVYDIGASVGFFAVLLGRQVGEQGRVVAIDPQPRNVEALRHNLALNAFTHIDVHEVAVGTAAGTARFAPGEQAVWGGLTEDADEAASGYDVRVVSLDEEVAAGRLPVPDLVKLDIEGGEGDALRGMHTILREHAPIVLCELHRTWDDVVPLLESAGYTVSLVEPGADIEVSGQAHVLGRPPAG
jgi:FkbM family methyltransferase